MKHYYVIEEATSVKNNQIIPARSLKWEIMDTRYFKLVFTYKDYDKAYQTRLGLQKISDDCVYRVRKISAFRKFLLSLRYSTNCLDW